MTNGYGRLSAETYLRDILATLQAGGLGGGGGDATEATLQDILAALQGPTFYVTGAILYGLLADRPATAPPATVYAATDVHEVAIYFPA